nr:hypothetical protein [uncultured Oscillibacter sp.]
MKRVLYLMALVFFTLALAGRGGEKISGSDIEIGPSDDYTEAEITAAMDIVQEHFENTFEGCTLTALRYDEDEVGDMEAEWAEQYDADQAIVLLSDFETDQRGGDGSLNPNDTYANWQWILVRTDGGEWSLKTMGYG